jgi:predicted alpha-1,6-mannanase (GH76 family)
MQGTAKIIAAMWALGAAAGCHFDHAHAQPADATVEPDGDAALPDAEVVAPDTGPGGDFHAYAQAAAAALHTYYNGSNGLWNTSGWWNSANALTATIDFSIATGSTAYLADIANTFAKNQASKFINTYYDDEGWWALAWIRAYDLTSDHRYLDMAKTIFADMKGGWDATCGGGIWWSKDKTYKNAIANELFLETAIQLHLHTAGDAGAGSFIDWAQREWAWFDQSGMINAAHLVNDGLGNCHNNNGTPWTYNQGVLIGGLVDLSTATGDATLVDRANAIAAATMTKLVDAQGVLHEKCEPSCNGDSTQFKGIFMRHLTQLLTKTGDPHQQAFITRNADWIWNAARNGSNQLGLTWSGPFDNADATRQSSALDALNAAIPFTDPQPNVARASATTASSSCSATQSPDKAVDGATTTKWCGGQDHGVYWLEVDLGAPTSVSRIIVRHASAGGETSQWNTRDFTLQLASGASLPATVATATANTLGVTIHRFDAVTAQRVRLAITKPQTDPMTVAARIYELEVYAR